ncbi:MAG: 7-carboxy-7-deazaguanine synthase QueE [Candidatus Gastranaerophilales bacterium]|nr:7-carboxy-7-deazaguanine synthase QueE [Candidatus Gastranaerophilales bacterium]
MEEKHTKIREIFESIQGEGPYVGQKHIFVRFCKCNLNCEFCDTDFDSKNAKNYDVYKLFNELDKIKCDTISFTGGEPLMDVKFLNAFLEEFKLSLNKKIYLETNGLLFEQLNEIIDLIDVVSMDIKLQSATGQPNRFNCNEEFLKIATKKEVFVKVVFDNNIIQEEIETCAYLAKKYNVLLVLQPKMPMDCDLKIEEIYNKFYEIYENVRLIPQVHKFLNVI